MPLAIDWGNQIIQITSPTTDVDMQTLHDFIEDQSATPEGLNYPAVITPEGKIEDPVNPGVYSQIIVILQSPWQIQFWGGSGYTRIYGGKLVGGLSDEPIKATGTAGDITVLESPVDGLTVVSGSGITEQDKDDIAQKVWIENSRELTTPNNYKADVSGLAPANEYDSELSALDLLIKQNREGNIKYEYVEAIAQNDNRNVAVGKLDSMIIKIKNDSDSDWSSPVSTKTLYMWYAALGDDDPIYVGESD